MVLILATATAAFGGVKCWSWREGLRARCLSRGEERDDLEKKAAILYVLVEYNVVGEA